MKKKILIPMLSLCLAVSSSSCTSNVLDKEPIIDLLDDIDNTNSREKDEIDKVLENENIVDNLENTMPTSTPSVIVEEIKESEIEKTSVTISAVGDCTLGRDDRSSYTYSLPYVFENQNNDPSYFFAGVYEILNNDDLTIANLEGTFTDATVRANKRFTFKGPSNYTDILLSGSVEAVNLANNHTYDYLNQGYEDTIEALDETTLKYFGNGIYSIIEVNGKTIGLCGIKGWDKTSACKEIDNAMAYFYECNTDLEIFSFHWGEERVYKQNSTQEAIARYAVDAGADLVLGHHPHVLQGIEEYNGKYIVYSLGNFVFGGNRNPDDKDTMIFQITFKYENNELVDTVINIIPTSLSSVSNINDYQPKILEGEEKEKVLKKILDSSTNLDYMEEN